jgi:hypothetical protein
VSIALSALFAGLVAVAVTLAIERWGGVVGGIIATLPSTIVPASIGIHVASDSDETFAVALAAAPAGMLLNALFLYLWRILPPRLPGSTLAVQLGIMTALGLGLWFGGALLTVSGVAWWRSGGGDSFLLGCVLTLAIVSVGVAATWRAHPAPAGRRPVGPATLAARGLLAACAIGSAVWLASVGGAVAAGVASCFPAIFLTTMVSLWISQGRSVPAGAVGPMMLGSASVAVYALIATWSLPALGIGAGCAFAWLGAAFGSSLPAVLWLRRRSESAA